MTIRLICLSGVLVGAIAMPAAAAGQGRGDHDTPQTQRQSEERSGKRYHRPACRDDYDGWVVCRGADGQWYRQRERYYDYWEPDSPWDVFDHLFD